VISKVSYLLTKKQKFIIFLIFIGNILTSAMEFISLGSIPVFISYILNPGIIDEKFKPFIDIVFSFSNENDLLKNFLIIIFSVFVLKNIFLGSLLYLEARFAFSFRKSLTTKLFAKYMSFPYLFHINTNPAKLIRNLTSEVGDACSVVSQFMIIFRDSLLLLIVATLVIIVDPETLSPVLLILGFVVLIIYKFFRSAVRMRGKISQEKEASLLQKIIESIGGIREIKIMNLQKDVVSNFNKELNIFEYQSFFIRVLNSFPKIIMELCGLILIVVIFYFFISLNKEIYEIFPILSLVAIGMVRAIPSFNSLLVASNNINFRRPAVDIIYNELITENDKHYIDENKLGYQKQTVNFNQIIELKNVEYNYLDRKISAINDISLQIKHGSKVGIIGPSGSGKTTLLNIILGLLKPTSGSVAIDNKNIFSNNLESWQKQIGYVSQNIFLIDATIKNNIALGQKNIDEEKIEKALKKSNLYDFVQNLPKKIETLIGNNGIKLSGGQHQRIGIARALYNNPKVLILDEATSSLDYKTEDEIFKDLELEKNSNTLIVVGHRLRTVAKCDVIYFLEKGKIKDFGKFEELKDKHSELRTGLN
jgi:ATP-binding cassette, subfamily B, bacterial PglK